FRSTAWCRRSAASSAPCSTTSEAGDAMSLHQFLTVLRARFKIIVLILLATVATVVAASLVLPKKYTATAAVVVDVKSPDPITGTMLHAMVMPGYMATQRDVISSDRVAQKVVKLLKLDEVPGTKEQWL